MDLHHIEPPGNEGKTNEWFTPKWIYNACGEFDLDPCGDKRWPIAKHTFESDGLSRDWFGRVWMNPPYGRKVKYWLRRWIDHGDGLALIFARTDTRWFQEIAPKCTWILFIKGRIHFVESDSLNESKNTPGAPSCILAVGPQPIPPLKGFVTKAFRRKV